MTKRVLLFDGHNNFIRNWMVVPTMDENGRPVGGITGFLRSTKNMIRDCKPTKVIIVWDGPGGSKRRRSVFSEYKEGRRPRANRTYDFESTDDSLQNMAWQRDQLKQLLSLLGIAQVEVSDVEADDVIAYLCRLKFPDEQKVIVSADKDFLQLIDGKTIIYSPSKKSLITTIDVKDSWGCLAENFIFMKALMGDGSDTIPGLGGFGPKTVTKLFPMVLERPITLEDIRKHAEAHVTEKPKYKAVLDGWDVLTRNVSLMQLSSPEISVHTARSIDSQLSSVDSRFALSEFRLALTRGGLQIIDVDFFPTFKEFHARTAQ